MDGGAGVLGWGCFYVSKRSVRVVRGSMCGASCGKDWLTHVESCLGCEHVEGERHHHDEAESEGCVAKAEDRGLCELGDSV